jgi:hypothetical protein
MPVLLSIIGPLTGGGHAAPAIEAPPPEDKAAAPVISTLGGALAQQAPPSLTFKAGFVFGKFADIFQFSLFYLHVCTDYW